MCCWQIYSKQWGRLLTFVITMFIAGAVSIGIFPAMLFHIFGLEKHSKTTVENLVHESLFEFVKRMWAFAAKSSELLFGVNAAVLAFVLLVAVVLIVKHKALFSCGVAKMFCWLMLIVPSACYYVFVSRVATYIDSRYMHPVYPVVFILGICALGYVIKILINPKYQWKLFGSLVLGLVIYGWIICPWDYLFSEDKSVETAEKYCEKECIFVYPEGNGNYLHSSFFEIRNYKQVTFFTEQNLELLKDSRIEEASELVVYITNNCDKEVVLKELMSVCLYVDEYEEISQDKYASAFYLN